MGRFSCIWCRRPPPSGIRCDDGLPGGLPPQVVATAGATQLPEAVAAPTEARTRNKRRSPGTPDVRPVGPQQPPQPYSRPVTPSPPHPTPSPTCTQHAVAAAPLPPIPPRRETESCGANWGNRRAKPSSEAARDGHAGRRARIYRTHTRPPSPLLPPPAPPCPRPSRLVPAAQEHEIHRRQIVAAVAA